MHKEKKRKTENKIERRRYRDKENPLYPPMKESILGSIFLTLIVMLLCIFLAGVILYNNNF